MQQPFLYTKTHTLLHTHTHTHTHNFTLMHYVSFSPSFFISHSLFPQLCFISVLFFSNKQSFVFYFAHWLVISFSIFFFTHNVKTPSFYVSSFAHFYLLTHRDSITHSLPLSLSLSLSLYVCVPCTNYRIVFPTYTCTLLLSHTACIFQHFSASSSCFSLF